MYATDLMRMVHIYFLNARLQRSAGTHLGLAKKGIFSVKMIGKRSDRSSDEHEGRGESKMLLHPLDVLVRA